VWKLVASFALLLIAGCNSIAGVAMMGPKDLQAQPTHVIAASYGDDYWGGGKALEAELRNRQAFTDAQWDQIKAKKIGVGDRGDLVLAAWGSPKDVNEYTSANGTTTIWRYEGGSTVWFDDGAVSLIRN